MKRQILLLGCALALVALPVFAGEGHCDNDAQACVNAMAEKAASHGWMGVDGEKDAATGYFRITEVASHSPAAEAGFHEGDVVTAINGTTIDMNDEAGMAAVMAALVPDAKVAFTVKTAHGKEKTLKVTLLPMPESKVAQMMGEHMLKHVQAADSSS